MELLPLPSPSPVARHHIGFGESDTIQFKEKWVEDAMADLAASANVRGGTLYLGVNKAGEIVGCDASDEKQKEIANKVAAHLGLVPDIRIEVVAGADILTIQIERAVRPIQLRGSYWRRSGTVSMKVPQEEWSRLALAHVGQSWDGLATDATVESDIDPVKVILARSLGGKHGSSRSS